MNAGNKYIVVVKAYIIECAETYDVPIQEVFTETESGCVQKRFTYYLPYLP